MSYKYTDTCLLVFAKAPVPGKVKTRLIPALGEDGACHFYTEMLSQIVERFALSKLCPIHLLCHPDTEHNFIKEISSKLDLQLFPQQGRDLGERMFHASTKALMTYSNVILIGADCPDYSIDYIEKSIDLLEDNDVVIGPAFDGGYVLIGMKRPYKYLFNDIEWSTGTVLQTTMIRIKENNLSCALLPPLNDIDRPEDLSFMKA